MIGLLVQNFALVLAMMILLWGVSIALKDVSFIDAFWAFGFVFVAIATFAATPGAGARKGLIVAVTLTWGLRLGGLRLRGRYLLFRFLWFRGLLFRFLFLGSLRRGLGFFLGFFFLGRPFPAPPVASIGFAGG